MTLAMQNRCVWCRREQYAPHILQVSRGEAWCCWCGQMSVPMNVTQYKTIINDTRNVRPLIYTCAACNVEYGNLQHLLDHLADTHKLDTEQDDTAE